VGNDVWIIRFKNYQSKLKALFNMSITYTFCLHVEYSRIAEYDITTIVGFEVLTAVLIKFQVFWNKPMTP